MEENERILTVYDFLSPSYLHGDNKFSRILLQGKWLRDLGFTVGKKVTVQIDRVKNTPKLIITLAD